MKTSTIRLAFVLFTTIFFGQGCLAQNQPDPAAPAPTQTAPPPATTPAPASPSPSTAPAPGADPYANVLGPEFKVLGYSIRPPKDFTYTIQPIQDLSRRTFTWQGALHQDGCVTTIAIGIKHLNAPEPHPASEFMIGFYKGLSKTLTNTKMSPSQPLIVGGMQALRATWVGTVAAKRSHPTLQGFVYVIQDGATQLSVVGTDSHPYFTKTFSTLNASALSFHK